jgi:hypothetical protein
MKRILTILISIITSTISFGQITTTKVADKVEQIDKTPYDSTLNFLNEGVQKYIGQELYLNGLNESLRKYGYKGFYIDYGIDSFSDKSNIYKCGDSYSSNYDELSGKYFLVLDVIKHPKAKEAQSIYANKYYLKLQEKENKDVVYYEYDSKFEHSFPFTVVGYFIKLKQTEVGKEFIVRGKNWISSSSPMIDMTSGKSVSNFQAGAKWRCIDVTIEEKYYSLSMVLANENGEKIPLSIDNSKRTNWVFEYTQAEVYKKKFGNEDWQRILDGKVKIGMTKEMCRLSWGEPKSVNETITAGKKTEQWVYTDHYLYFDNEILTVMQ